MSKENIKEEKVQQPRRSYLLIILSIVTLVCIIFFILCTFYVCNRDGFRKEISIVKDETTVDNMKITALNLHPGDSVDYEVVFKSTASGDYQIVLDFSETLDGGLKDYVIVSIVDGDKKVLEKSLTEVLAGGDITLNCEIKAYNPYSIYIKYLMPVDTGNDAMSTNASFEIEFTIDMV